ncbi:hypothetical protein K1719_015322 [Acacia pycnantha]|nr:hypothetical protein K1719_015322 [Acacia pycnantha]
MDPSSYTPPTPTVADPPTAVRASAPLADAPANPTSENYDQMICTAIATLEKGTGYTKNAIGKCMEQIYQGLPSNHDDLLIERLNVLTSNRRLVMVNRSYTLPNSPSPSPRKRGRPCKRKFDESPPDDFPLDDNPPKRHGCLLKIEENMTPIPVPFASPRDFSVPAYAVPHSGASPEAVGAGSGGAVTTRQDPAGSSVGRPKKVPSVEEEELRRKLEHFQSKVKEYIREIKPHFNIESSIKVIVAIQGLQRLATMDLDGPLPNETQELPPQQ